MAVKIINENSVSSNLPKTIDKFLQDFAQVYGGISYSDIVKLGDVWDSASVGEIKLTIRGIKQELKDYAGDLYELSEENATVKKLCDKLIKLVKNASTKRVDEAYEDNYLEKFDKDCDIILDKLSRLIIPLDDTVIEHSRERLEEIRKEIEDCISSLSDLDR